MLNHAKSDAPSSVRRLLNTAKAHIDAGRVRSAIPLYEEVVAMAPDSPDAHHTLGLAYLETGRYDRAVAHIGRSIEMNPTNDGAYRSMGDALQADSQYAMAMRAYEKAIRLNPDNLEALLHLGNLLHELDRYDAAQSCFERIVSKAPHHRQALNNLGKLNHDMGNFMRAMRFFDRALRRYPDYADAQFNRAALLLATGELKRGWKAYEWRFKRSGASHVYPHRLGTPRWQGEPFNGRRLLVHCEQGMGDVLQFLRYLPLAKSRGGTVWLEVHTPLLELLQGQAGIDKVVAFDPQRPTTARHDLHIPLLSLPGVLTGDVNAVPQNFPYIKINSDSIGPWRHHLKPGHLNIGLVWSSSAVNPKRNLPIEACDAWFQNPRLHFIGLQKDARPEQIEYLQRRSTPIPCLGPQLANFNDTANAMAGLDLVISVDTAAAHLAGAMGMPLWALLPFNADWRWPRDGERCTWYPQTRIFRQPNPGSWDQVIASVAEKLQCLSPGDLSSCKTPLQPEDPLTARLTPAAPVPEMTCTDPAKTYIGLVNGENYGWGVCSKYLIEELSKRQPIHVLNEADGSACNERLDGTLFQALTNVTFEPLFKKARGIRNFGYTFFENELTRQSVENAEQYDLIMAGSSWCRDRMREKGINNCELLIQGIDPKRFYPIDSETAPDRFVIYSGGKFELRKGQDILLRAVKILQDRYPDIYLLNCWVNMWPDSLRQMTSSPYIDFSYHEDLPWADLMRRTYLDNGLDPDRVLTMDLVPHRELRTVFKQTDIGVFPNRCEGGTNLMLMEYMACAKPVIATFASGHRDIVTAENALLLNHLKSINILDDDGIRIGRWKDPSLDELVGQLEYAYRHRRALKSIGARAGKDLQQFTWRRCAERLAMLLER